MKKILLTILLLLNLFTARVQTLIQYDYMETFTWFGDWFLYNNSGFFTDISVSPNLSAAHWGSGSSSYELDWYVLPNVVLDPSKTHMFKFRLAAQRISNPSAGSSGLDVGDYVEVQVSTDGGINYTSEIRITGFSNATWGYNTNGVIMETVDGLNQIYTPTNGGDRTNTGDGWSDISLIIPSGVSNLAIDLFVRANANGEDWWIDNIELFELFALPVELIYFDGDNNGGINIVKWSTASEQNSDYFLVSKSQNGEFNENSVINIVKAAGNSTEKIDYKIFDADIKEGLNYYQLTQVDFDGNYKEYGPIVIDNRSITKKIIKKTNLLGQEINDDYRGVIIEVYDDGTTILNYR